MFHEPKSQDQSAKFVVSFYDNAKSTLMCKFEKAAAIGNDYSLIFSEIVYPIEKCDSINNSIAMESIDRLYDAVCLKKKDKPGSQLKSNDYVSIAADVLSIKRTLILEARKKCPYSDFNSEFCGF